MMTALIVDDSATMRRIHQKALEQLGFSTVSAEDGVQAVATLGQRGCELIVTDLHMPNMDGLELILAVRGRLNLAAPKILMVTSDGVMDVIEKAMAAGANDVLVKPFSAAVFAERVRGLVGGG